MPQFCHAEDSNAPRPRLDLSNATLEEIERRYEGRVLNAVTGAALAEDPRAGARYKSARQLIKALKS
jgi:hypothetical protein